jgi:outer membrane protein OmpA-like peptidoglycan-associated protein
MSRQDTIQLLQQKGRHHDLRCWLPNLSLLTSLDTRVASAQSTEDIVEKLQFPPSPAVSPQPRFKGLPTDPNYKGVTIIEPTEEKSPSIDLQIPFEYNSDKLTFDAFTILRRLGAALKDNRLTKDHFRIAGHTDARGTPEYNQKLSERRAQAVRDYLVAQYDVDPNQLETVGYGLTQPIDPAHPLDGINRRVQVVNLGRGH